VLSAGAFREDLPHLILRETWLHNSGWLNSCSAQGCQGTFDHPRLQHSHCWI